MSMDILVFVLTAACGVVGGLSVVGAVRWSGARAAMRCQRLFIVCLVCLGACTLFAVGQERTYWILGAAVFGALSVVATVDYSAARSTPARDSHWPIADGQNHTNFAGWHL